MLQLVAQFLIVYSQTKPLGLDQDCLLADQVFSRALSKEGHQHRHLRAATWKLLFDHLSGLALHLKPGHFLATNFGDYPLARTTKTRAPSARHQIPNHGNANEKQ